MLLSVQIHSVLRINDMPSVATIESVLRLSAPVQLRVSVPVQLRVSAPVQFRLGPASQRAECREVSVPDWLPRAQSGAEQRMSVPDWLVDWLPPSAEWSRECLSPFSPPPNRPPREVSVPDWLPPSAEWSRECLSLFDLPRSTSRARPPVRPPLPNQPREVSVPDWLVDWLPPNSE